MSHTSPAIQNPTARLTAEALLALDMPALVSLARRAGRAILDVYQEDFSVDYKNDSSPVTAADLESNQIICEGLSALLPGVPVISEESMAETFDVRRQWPWFWLVDPLDGTREFVGRTGEFTVNIALIQGRKPVLGVVHAPALGVTFYARQGTGAFKLPSAGDQPERIHARPLKGRSEVVVVGSRSHPSPALVDYLRLQERIYSRVDFVAAGSALKFCRVAEGSADIYPRLAPTWEWDTAAGQVIVAESGKRVLELSTSEELSYNKPDLKNPWFVCT